MMIYFNLRAGGDISSAPRAPEAALHAASQNPERAQFIDIVRVTPSLFYPRSLKWLATLWHTQHHTTCTCTCTHLLYRPCSPGSDSLPCCLQLSRRYLGEVRALARARLASKLFFFGALVFLTPSALAGGASRSLEGWLGPGC